MAVNLKMSPAHKQWAILKGFATREEEDARAQEEAQVKCNWDEIGNKPEVFKPEEHEHTQYATRTTLDTVAVNLQKYTKDEIAKVVNGAPEALDTLNELASALGKNENGVTELLTKVGKVEESLNDYALKTDIPVIPEDHITREELDKVSTKVDLVEASIPDVSNFATKEEVVSAKNEAIVAASGDAASKYATIVELEEVKASIPSIPNDHATKSELNDAISAVEMKIPTIPSHDHLATKEELATAMVDVIKYDNVTDSTGTSYKTIHLGNKETLSIANSRDVRHDVVAINKSNDVIIGSEGLHININTRDNITVNTNDVLATTTYVANKIASLNIPDTSIFAVHGEVLDAKVEAINTADANAASKYATITSVKELETEVEEIKSTIPSLPKDHVTREDLANAIEEVEAKIPDVPSDHVTMEELSAAVFRINVLEDKVTALSKTNVTPVVAGASAKVNDESADLVIAKSETPITEVTSYTGKSVEVKSMDVASSKVKLNAVAGDLTISNYTSSGSIEGKVVEIEAYSGEHVKITNCILSQSGYNAINIGNTKTTVDTAPKSILIDNVQLNGTMTNNAINIYGQKDNAVITISNCHFEGVSNPVRLFNVTNTACTVNFINCTCSTWEADANELMYSGFLLCEDATSANIDEEVLLNRFGRDKVTVNFINCYGPHGKIESADPSIFCGTANSSQLIYVFRHNSYKVEKELDSTNVSAGIVAYGNGSSYPTITIK